MKPRETFPLGCGFSSEFEQTSRLFYIPPRNKRKLVIFIYLLVVYLKFNTRYQQYFSYL